MIRMKLHLYSTCLFVILMLMLSIQTNAFSDYSTNLVYNGYIQDGFGDIDVGMYSVPVVHDWNNDGKKDILIGQNNGGNGYISYYENTGSNNSPLFNSPTYIEACNTVCQYLNVTAGG